MRFGAPFCDGHTLQREREKYFHGVDSDALRLTELRLTEGNRCRRSSRWPWVCQGRMATKLACHAGGFNIHWRPFWPRTGSHAITPWLQRGWRTSQSCSQGLITPDGSPCSSTPATGRQALWRAFDSPPAKPPGVCEAESTSKTNNNARIKNKGGI